MSVTLNDISDCYREIGELIEVINGGRTNYRGRAGGYALVVGMGGARFLQVLRQPSVLPAQTKLGALHSSRAIRGSGSFYVGEPGVHG